MEGGSCAVEKLRVGDLVWSRDEMDPDGPLALKSLLQTFERSAFVLNLRVGGKDIGTTSDHPFYVAVHGWRSAGELKVGDMVRLNEG